MTEGQNRYCVQICVLSSPPFKFMFHMGFFRWKWLFEESDWASWIAQNETTGRENMKLHHNPRQNNLTNVRWYKWQLVPPPRMPSASKYMFSKTVIGPMLDVEQALCPHHEVKFTFMKLKSQVGFLCWYGFKRHYCSALLPQHHVLLNSPTQEEWNAWKHHYCALTWSTVNGWVKVPFEMHDIKRKKKVKKPKHTHKKPSPCIMLYRLGKVNVKTIELSSNIFAWCPLNYISNFSHTLHNKPALHVRKTYQQWYSVLCA